MAKATANSVISRRILSLVAAGASVPDAVDEVLGKGTYKLLADDIFDAANKPKGYKANPPLLIWPNPPRDGDRFPLQLDQLMSKGVHSLAYTHVGDSKDYRHDFGRHTYMWSAKAGKGKRVIVIERPDGRDLWADF